ncbi:MAG: hypothetical protein M1829_001951 [Trizodia sp. TS-e1964]|nr:MAG: hypothetical protein M1829_001951 [Trizodia sp. TS-e1964]
MGLVDYSDSENSDIETARLPKANAKPAFQKAVDPANSHKIRVNFPTPNVSASDDKNPDEPPSKKPRTGGGGLGGFNSLLPAPKRSNQIVEKNASGLGKGVNLKTGALTSFSREPEPDTTAATALVGNPVPTPTGSGESSSVSEAPPLTRQNVEPIKKLGTPTMFRPLSVARKPIKKKPSTFSSTDSAKAVPSENAETKTKISLFSIEKENATDPIPVPANGPYQPMILNPAASHLSSSGQQQFEESDIGGQDSSSISEPVMSHAPTLDSIAGELNLSASARRQLFGRKGQASSKLQATAAPITVINFNTDQEYAANESLRAAGETVQHNPVKAIAPGKHSLKQLVNAASTQKDALEEHFASGRRNKKEAGSKYGWST